MSKSTSVGLVALAIILALGAIWYTLWRIEDKLLATLVTVLVACIGTSIVAIGVGFGGALWRKAGNPPRPERHIYHTKERILDGRVPHAPQIVQLRENTPEIVPELLRATYRAGAEAERRLLPPGVPWEIRDPETGDLASAGLGDIGAARIIGEEESGYWQGQVIFEEV